MKIQITAVNYLNTLPFKYGLMHTPSIFEWADINYASPYECAKMLIHRQTNIALAPVAVLSLDTSLQILTPFCLSTNQVVKSVKLYSKKNIDAIKSIILDYQSLSSVYLTKVLMQYHWKKEVQYIQGYEGFEKKLEQADAMVVIGDRTFELNGQFEYEYDLATEWYRFYGKPFVFAAWITNTPLDEIQLQQLHSSFEYGLSHINECVEEAMQLPALLPHINDTKKRQIIYEYLTENMQYHLTEDRKNSLFYFLQLIKTLQSEKLSLEMI